MLYLGLLIGGVLAVNRADYPAPLQVPAPNPQWTAAIEARLPAVGAPVIEKCNGQDQWALTYDDGPSPSMLFLDTVVSMYYFLLFLLEVKLIIDDHSPLSSLPLQGHRCPIISQQSTTLVLDALAAKGQKGTFFVVGSQILEYESILQRIVRHGHQVGIHTWSHPSLPSLNVGQIVAELAWSAKLIKEVTGVAPTVMRPPYGDDNENVRRVSTAMGLSVVEWNRDTEDYKFSTWKPGDAGSPNSIAQQLSTWVSQPRQGTISLQHDIQMEPARQAAPALDVVMRAGYQLVTVADCIGKPAYSDSLLTLLNGGNPPPPSPVTSQVPTVTTMVVPPVTTVISSTTTVLPAMTTVVSVDPPTVTGSDGFVRKVNGTGVQSAGFGLAQHSGIWTIVLAVM